MSYDGPKYFLDTCATFSMTGDPSILKNGKPWSGTESGADTLGNENRITAIGDLDLKIEDDKGDISREKSP